MNILYVSSESPIYPAGGIGTYIGYAAAAMRELGHNIYLLTWTYNNKEFFESKIFTKQNVEVVNLSGEVIWKKFPSGPYNIGCAYAIEKRISECVDRWSIDVVEACDYLSPALKFFTKHQSSRRAKDLVCVTYNHGLSEQSYEAARLGVGAASAAELVGERQQCRISDLVIAPSLKAKSTLARYDILENVEVIREPFHFKNLLCPESCNGAITHIGRVSIAKGIDKLILSASILSGVIDVERILFLGSLVDTPYRTRKIETFIKQKMPSELAAKLIFAGHLPREVALSMLFPGDIAPLLSLSETFSYSFVEMLDRGLLPIVEKNTAVSEFFPRELQNFLIDFREDNVSILQNKFHESIRNTASIVKQLQEYNADKLDPKMIAVKMTAAYERAANKKVGLLQKQGIDFRKECLPSDVTFLMSAYNPKDYFYEAIDSIAAQSVEAAGLIICDDGTSSEIKNKFEYAFLRISNVTINRQKNMGLLAARNNLVDSCGTELCVFIDDDDIIESKFVEHALEAYNNHPQKPNAVIFPRFNFGESDEIVIRNNMHDHTHLFENDFRMTSLIETSVLRDIRFDMSVRDGEADDWAFWIEFHARGYKAVMLPSLFFRYRFKSGSMSWPWSEGQEIGTHLLLRAAMTNHKNYQNKDEIRLAEAIYSMKSRRR